MKIKGAGLKYKLIFSYILIILVSFCFIAFFKTVFLSLIFALGLAFVLGSALTTGIIKPLNKIAHISRKFSRGDFSQKILLGSRDEIGELAATLNKMAEGLENKIKKIEVQNQYQRAILESMVEGIIVADNSGHIVSINPSVEKIFDITRQDSEGKLFLEVIRNNDIADVIAGVLEGGKFVSREISLIWPVQRIFQINASPIFEKNAVCGCLLVIHDITEIRRLEVVRRDFVANVSHELKTPLTSIKGFVETLLDEGALEDKENSLHFLRIIRTHADRLDALVNDLLDLSRLESQEISLEKDKISLKDLADDVLASFKSQLKEKEITPKNDLPADLSPRAGREEMRRVLINLIDNAVKFNSEKGHVRIYSQDMDDKVKVVIEDSGAGIPEKDVPRIFERFYRVDKARSRELGGTGLGLSIVKHIVELHGGSVGVESTENLGSKFWFTLPK
ncbi:MAG: ATP-binding protein, partial [Candidatus Omnitrophota bacterium]